MGIQRERLRRIEEELRPSQRIFVNLLPLLFHINHPMLPGFINTTTPAGIPDYTPSQAVLRAAKKLSRSFEYKKRAQRQYQIHGLYLMGSIGSVAHTAGSDLDVWLCHDPALPPNALKVLKAKVADIEAWASELGLEVHVFAINAETFRRGERDRLSHESSGSTQPRLLLEEFYRTGVLLAGRYPLWWLVPPHEEMNYTEYAAMLLHKRFVDALDCIDFGGLEELPAHEFFGAAHWQLFKGIESPYKTILKLLLTEAYTQEYPQVHWPCQEAKSAIYEGCIDMDQLDPYVLMYRRVEQYLSERGESKRLDLARRCLYFKTDQPLSREPVDRHECWQRSLLKALIKDWGWSQAELAILDARGSWKIDRVMEERNTLVRELTHSYRLLTDFARTYVHSSPLDSEELSLLGRKLYTALEKRPGKIDGINPGISRDLAEELVSLHHARSRDEQQSWSLFVGEVTEDQARAATPIKRTTSLIEMLTWCHLNRIIDRGTHIMLYPTDNSPVQKGELQSLLAALDAIYPDGSKAAIPMEHLANQPHAIACTLFINTGIDPMAHLAKLGRQLTSNRSDPLSFGAAHACLATEVEQLITTSWGETLVLTHRQISGLLNSLCHFLRLALIHPGKGGIPEVSAHSFSSVRASGIARRVEKLFNDVGRSFSPEAAGLYSRYLLQVGHDYYLIQCRQQNFSYIELQNQDDLLDLLGEPQFQFCAVVIDEMTLQETPLPVIFEHNREGLIQLFYYTEKETTHLYALDEQGALFRQQTQTTDEQYLILQQQRFLNGIRMMRSLLAEEPAHRLLLDAPEFYRLSRDREQRFTAELRTPPRHRLPDTYLELRLLSEGLELNSYPYMLVCGDREFGSLEYGDQLFEAVAEFILTHRRNRQSYPIYLTGLELSGVSGEGLAPTIELFNFKKRLEHRLNQALDSVSDS